MNVPIGTRYISPAGQIWIWEGAWVQEKDATPPEEENKDRLSQDEYESLVLIRIGKAWKVSTVRIENLTNRGLVNSMGTDLTELGKEIYKRGP